MHRKFDNYLPDASNNFSRWLRAGGLDKNEAG